MYLHTDNQTEPRSKDCLNLHGSKWVDNSMFPPKDELYQMVSGLGFVFCLGFELVGRSVVWLFEMGSCYVLKYWSPCLSFLSNWDYRCALRHPPYSETLLAEISQLNKGPSMWPVAICLQGSGTLQEIKQAHDLAKFRRGQLQERVFRSFTSLYFLL